MPATLRFYPLILLLGSVFISHEVTAERLDFIARCPRAPRLVRDVAQQGVALEFFAVYGRSLRQVGAFLSSHGPVDGEGRRRWALFSWSVVQGIDARPSGREIRERAHLRFPCLASRGVAPRLRRWWYHMTILMARHEKRHIAIHLKLRQRLESVKAMHEAASHGPPSMGTSTAQSELGESTLGAGDQRGAIVADLVAQAQREQREFDRITENWGAPIPE